MNLAAMSDRDSWVYSRGEDKTGGTRDQQLAGQPPGTEHSVVEYQGEVSCLNPTTWCRMAWAQFRHSSNNYMSNKLHVLTALSPENIS
jgi:hypothetical protein